MSHNATGMLRELNAQSKEQTRIGSEIFYLPEKIFKAFNELENLCRHPEVTVLS